MRGHYERVHPHAIKQLSALSTLRATSHQVALDFVIEGRIAGSLPCLPALGRYWSDAPRDATPAKENFARTRCAAAALR